MSLMWHFEWTGRWKPGLTDQRSLQESSHQLIKAREELYLWRESDIYWKTLKLLQNSVAA